MVKPPPAIAQQEPIRAAEPKLSAFAADVFHLSRKKPFFPFAHPIDGKLERRRTCVNAEDRFFHGSVLPPAPVRHFRKIFSVRGNVLLMLGQLTFAELNQRIGSRLKSRYAADGIQGELEAIHVVAHYHVEWSSRGPLLFVSANVEVVVVGAAVSEAMDQPRISVISKDHRPAGSEERVEVRVFQTMGMFRRGLQGHEINHVNDSDS